MDKKLIPFLTWNKFVCTIHLRIHYLPYESHLDVTWVSQSLYSGPLSNPDFFLSLIAGRIRQVVLYSTVQAFFHQPAHPRGEGATIKRISPPRKPPAGGDCGGSAAFPRWVLQIKIDGQSLPVFRFSWSPPRVRGGIK